MMLWKGIAGVCAWMFVVSPAWAEGHAHVHGEARLEIAVEVRRITIELNAPLDNLVGFERAPRNAAERERANAAVARLHEGAVMFRIDPAASCTLTSMDLSSAALELGHPDPSEAENGHADLDGTYVFDCEDAGKAAMIETDLFGFSNVRRIDVAVVTPSGQFKRDLERPAGRILLRRQ